MLSGGDIKRPHYNDGSVSGLIMVTFLGDIVLRSESRASDSKLHACP